MTDKTLPPQPGDQIKKLEAERNELSKQLGRSNGAENARIHSLIADKHQQLGKLYLARDKLERPEIYATAENLPPSERAPETLNEAYEAGYRDGLAASPSQNVMGSDKALLDQAGRDIRTLLSEIAFLEDLTGEKLEDEDAALVENIRQSWPAANAAGSDNEP